MIDARTTLVFPNPENLDEPRRVGSIDIENDYVYVGHRGCTVLNPELEGRPVRAIWIGDRFAGFGFSSVEGEPVDEAQAALILAAVADGRVLDTDEVMEAVTAGQRAGLRSDDDMASAPLRKLVAGRGEPGYLSQWHTRAGNVGTEYDEFEILRQITGMTGWSVADEDLRTGPACCVFTHPAGIEAVSTYPGAGTLALAITTPTSTVERLVDVAPTLEPKAKAAKKAA